MRARELFLKYQYLNTSQQQRTEKNAIAINIKKIVVARAYIYRFREKKKSIDSTAIIAQY